MNGYGISNYNVTLKGWDHADCVVSYHLGMAQILCMRIYPLLTLHLSSSLTSTSTFLTGFETFHKPEESILEPCDLLERRCARFHFVGSLTSMFE